MRSFYISGVDGDSLPEIAARWFDPRRQVPEKEHFDRFSQTLPFLVEEAKRAREQAVSYRNFHVGCVMFAFKTDTWTAKGRWQTLTGGNIKVTPETRTICAEMIALGAVKAAKCDRVIGIVICGTPQKEEGCAEDYPTLHPCKECRKTFKASPEISEDTIIVMVTPDGETYEIHTFGELLKIHGEAGKSGTTPS